MNEAEHCKVDKFVSSMGGGDLAHYGAYSVRHVGYDVTADHVK